MVNVTNSLRALLGKSETETALTVVKDGVVLLHEDVTEDPELLARRQVKTHDSEQTEAGSRDGVLLAGERVGLVTEGDVEVRKRRDLGAVNGVLVGAELGGTDGISKLGDISGGTSDQRGTGVDNGHRDLGDLGSVDSHGSEVSGPVGLGSDRHPRKLTLKVILVDATNNELTVLVGLLGQVEREDGVIDRSLLDHVLEDSLGAINGDGRESKTENTVELADEEGKSQTGSVSDLSELLLRDVDISNRDGVARPETRDRARTILDGELGSVLGKGGRLGGLVTGVHTARQPASVSGNPKVGRTSVIDDVEGLRRRSNGDRAIVLGVLVVVDADGATKRE